MGKARAVRAKRRKAAPSRVGLALAGGGPLGGIYELGALLALSESLEGVDFNALDVYVGVSSGGFIAAGLANGLTPERMRHMFIESDTAEEPFEPELLLKPAFREYALRALSVPPLLLASIWNYLANPWSQSFFESFQRLSRAIPTGIFNISGIDRFLDRTYALGGGGEIEALVRPSNRQEIALSLKAADRPFALIKIGDISGWLKEELAGYTVVEGFGDEAFALRAFDFFIEEGRFQVLVDGQVVDEVVALEDEPDLVLVELGQSPLIERVDRLIVEVILALRRRVEHPEDMEDRRLPRPRRPHDGQEFALAHVQINVPQHECFDETAAVKLGDAP